MKTVICLAILVLTSVPLYADEGTFAELKAAADRQAKKAPCDCAVTGECNCGATCPCLNCPARVMASPPQGAVGQMIRQVGTSSYAALRGKTMVNGQTVIVAVGCRAPEDGNYVVVQADDRDGLRPGNYIVAGKWHDGHVYVERYFPTDATSTEIRNAIEQSVQPTQPAIQYVQQPQQQMMYTQQSYAQPMQSSFGFGGGYSGGMMMGGGGACVGGS